MPNLIEYAALFQRALDEQTVQQATSGWMTANAGRVRYEGGATVKIPTLTVSGLGDYDRVNEKYPVKGSVNLAYQNFTVTQDRACEISFDRFDVDESDLIVNAQNTIANFQRMKLIPEVDSYRYSKIAALAAAGSVSSTYAAAPETALNQFLTDLNGIRDRSGIDGSGLVATVSYKVYGMLERSAQMTRMLIPQEFERGSLKFEVKSIDGVPIIPVSSDRMKTAYVFHAGNGGDPALGYEAAAAAKDINWIICPRSAPIAINKFGGFKIFAPDNNLIGDSWKINYRIYHDLWVTANQLPLFAVSIGA